MRENENMIDEEHRKELLRFLLVKTAAVRLGVKPAELLRVRHCYASVNAEGLRVCLYRSDIYGILGLALVTVVVLFTMHNTAIRNIKIAEIKINKAIGLLNKTKLKYSITSHHNASNHNPKKKTEKKTDF